MRSGRRGPSRADWSPRKADARKVRVSVSRFSVKHLFAFFLVRRFSRDMSRSRRARRHVKQGKARTVDRVGASGLY